jgi:hypothetical protein
LKLLSIILSHSGEFMFIKKNDGSWMIDLHVWRLQLYFIYSSKEMQKELNIETRKILNK